MKRDAALQAYFAEAASWDADRVAASERSMRTAWRVAVGACVLALAAIFALVLLMPLKRVDPFVIRVDNATGIVDVVPVFAGQATMPEVVTRYFLDHYLTVCERFNFSTAEPPQGWLQRARAGQLDHVLQARQWHGGSGAGPVREGAPHWQRQ
jgi:type IV secretion system protein VirB8